MPINLLPGEELVVETSFDPAWKKYSLVTNMIAMAFLGCILLVSVLLPDVAKNGRLRVKTRSSSVFAGKVS